MNERRSELVADVQKALELAYDTGWECGTGDVMREVTAGRDAANEVVARSDYLNDADLVIAHLWEQAMQPEVVDDVAASIPFAFLSSHSIETVRTNWETREEIMGDRSKLVLRREALNAITALLTALLGPNPNEQETNDE